MKTLNFICPRCMSEHQKKVHLNAHYEDDDLSIFWECTECKFKGEFLREIRKPNMFIRIIHAIKRAWR